MINYLPRYFLLLLTLSCSVSVSASSIVTVGQYSSHSRVMLGGTVIPFKEVTLNAQMPGRVTYIAGAEGKRFNASELLLTLDSTALQAKRQAAMADVQKAYASMQNAQTQYGRELVAPSTYNIGTMPGMGMPAMFDNMFMRNFGSVMGYGNPAVDRQADLMNQSTQWQQTMAGVQQAQMNLAQVDAAIRDAQSQAPFEGVITRKMVEVGDTVQPGQPLLKFAHTRYLRIQAEVPVRLVSALQVGQFVPAVLDVGKTQVQARVAHIYPIADPKRHTVTVKLDLPEGVPGGAGMYAEVAIPDAHSSLQSSQVVIPKTALMKGASLPGVLRLNDEGQSELRILRVGKELPDGRIVVLSGLAVGDQIIDSPPTGVSSGWMPAAK